MVLALREWAGKLGYVTRDYANFEVAYEVTAPAAKAEPVKVEPAKVEPVKVEAVKEAPAKPAVDSRVSIMRGTVEELAAVKGLTRKLAVEIIKHRPFASLDELVEVRGIGAKMVTRLRPYLTL